MSPSTSSTLTSANGYAFSFFCHSLIAFYSFSVGFQIFRVARTSKDLSSSSRGDFLFTMLMVFGMQNLGWFVLVLIFFFFQMGLSLLLLLFQECSTSVSVYCDESPEYW